MFSCSAEVGKLKFTFPILYGSYDFGCELDYFSYISSMLFGSKAEAISLLLWAVDKSRRCKILSSPLTSEHSVSCVGFEGIGCFLILALTQV